MFEVLLGTLTGLLGTGLTSYIDYKNKKQAHEFELKRMDIDHRNMVKEIELSIVKADREAVNQAYIEEAKAFATSMNAQISDFSIDKLTPLLSRSDYWSLVTVPVGVLLLFVVSLVEILNKLMRPLLTLYSLAIASWVTYRCWEALTGVSLPAGDLIEQWGRTSETILFLAVTMVTWWFGDRRVANHLMHQQRRR